VGEQRKSETAAMFESQRYPMPYEHASPGPNKKNVIKALD